MPELIDKKRTEAKVFLIARHFIDRPDREVELVRAVIHRCCEEIDKQPTIEAEPVRHGQWIDARFVSGGDFYRCSECGCYIEKTYFANDYNVQYCPNCGARMDADHIADDSKKVGGADNG